MVRCFFLPAKLVQRVSFQRAISCWRLCRKGRGNAVECTQSLPQCVEILLIELGETVVKMAHTSLPETLCKLLTGFSEASQGKAAVCSLLHSLAESRLHPPIHPLTSLRLANPHHFPHLPSR